MEGIKELAEKGHDVIFPSPKDVMKGRGRNWEYGEEDFEYKEEGDLYKCKGGQELRLAGEREDKGRIYKTYRARRKGCKKCGLKEECMGKGKKGTGGKEIWVLKDKEIIERQGEVVERNKEILRKRGTVIEGGIGRIKNGLRLSRFLLRGLRKVKGEWGLMLTALNLIKFYILIKKGLVQPRFGVG